MFLRCHDELSLEMVTPEERSFIYNSYIKDPRWNYRQGEGISARLAMLFGGDFRKIRLAYSIMFTLLGTPIIYYGDEFAKQNDEAFYQEMFKHTGYLDSRYFVRGRINWQQVEQNLQNPETLAYQIYHTLQTMIRVRKAHKAFSRGNLEFVHLKSADNTVNKHILAYDRVFEEEHILVIQNLSAREQSVQISEDRKKTKDLLDQELVGHNNDLILPPYAFYWL
jgi:maltose alpha-D-glucosyltransferase/alpha-amylase